MALTVLCVPHLLEFRLSDPSYTSDPIRFPIRLLLLPKTVGVHAYVSLLGAGRAGIRATVGFQERVFLMSEVSL